MSYASSRNWKRGLKVLGWAFEQDIACSSSEIERLTPPFFTCEEAYPAQLVTAFTSTPFAACNSVRISRSLNDPNLTEVSDMDAYLSADETSDPSPNDVVKFPCPSLLPLSSSTVGKSKAGDKGRVEGNSMGVSS
jgi:hypothetical protein